MVLHQARVEREGEVFAGGQGVATEASSEAAAGGREAVAGASFLILPEVNMEWTADIVNDPSREFALYVDIMEGDEHRATLFRDSDGVLRMNVYPSDRAFNVPVHWVLEMAERDI